MPLLNFQKFVSQASYIFVVILLSFCNVKAQESNDVFVSFEFLAKEKAAIFQIMAQSSVADELGLTRDQQLASLQLFQQLTQEIKTDIAPLRPSVIKPAQLKTMTEEEVATHLSLNADEMAAIRIELGKKYHDRFLDILLPIQSQRLKELIAQSYLNQGIMFAEYSNKEISTWIDLSDNERKELSDSSSQLRAKFLETVKQLHAKHHLKLREQLDDESRKNIDEILGPPQDLHENNFYPTSRRRQ